MVELGGCPPLRGMAGAAVLPESPGMGVVLFMAGKAVFRRGGEVCQGERMGMTLIAGHVLMPPGQGKGKTVVSECFTEAVHPIMTAKAVRAISH